LPSGTTGSWLARDGPADDRRRARRGREGYSSSLAAALLRAIGFARATDVIGGVDAWREAGLPLEPYGDRA
jgi:hypothetical protein